MREELTDSAWVMSHELQEKIHETEAAADDLKMLRPLQTPKGHPELQEEETAIRLQLARAEKALAPKQREVAEALLGGNWKMIHPEINTTCYVFTSRSWSYHISHINPRVANAMAFTL